MVVANQIFKTYLLKKFYADKIFFRLVKTKRAIVRHVTVAIFFVVLNKNFRDFRRVPRVQSLKFIDKLIERLRLIRNSRLVVAPDGTRRIVQRTFVEDAKKVF